jgi:hypothetical protein
MSIVLKFIQTNYCYNTDRFNTARETTQKRQNSQYFIAAEPTRNIHKMTPIFNYLFVQPIVTIAIPIDSDRDNQKKYGTIKTF